MCDTTMRGKVRWLSLSGRDFVKELELKLVLDAQVDKYDVKNNTSQVWSRSLVVICLASNSKLPWLFSGRICDSIKKYTLNEI